MTRTLHSRCQRVSTGVLTVALTLVLVLISVTGAHAAAPRPWSAPGPVQPAVLAADTRGVVAVGYLGEIVALDLAGHEQWRLNLLNAPVYWRPALGVDVIVVSLGDRLAALDRHTGAVKWEKRLDTPRVAVGATADGTAIAVATTGSGQVAAFDLATGAQRWSLRYREPMLVAAHVVVAGGLVYVTWPKRRLGRVSAIDAATGAVRWEQAIGALAAEPVVTHALVVVAEGDGHTARVRALDAATGVTRWTVPVIDGFFPGYLPAVSGDDYAVVDTHGRVSLVDVRAGRLRWRSRIRSRSRVTQLLLTSGSVLVPLGDLGERGIARLDRRTGRVTGSTVAHGILRAVAPGAGPRHYELVERAGEGIVRAVE